MSHLEASASIGTFVLVILLAPARFRSGTATTFIYLFPQSIVKENLLVSDTHHKVTFAFYTGVDSPGLFFRQSGALNFEMTVGGIYYDDKLQSDLNRRLTFYFKGTKLRHSTQDV